MKKAAESAAKWLTEKAKSNPKLNPVPYPFFRSIINKQIEWASKRGVNLNFDELSEAVRTELLKSGIHTMSGNGTQEHKTSVSDDGIIFPLHLNLNVTTPHSGALEPMRMLFKWFNLVFEKASAEGYSCLRISVNAEEEDVENV